MSERLPLLPLILENVPRAVKQVLAQEGIAHRDRDGDPQAGRFVLFDSRQSASPRLSEGQIPIDVNLVRLELNGDVFADLVDERSCPHVWEVGSLRVTEEVSLIDKRRLRISILAILRQEIEAAGGVWFRISPFPFPYRSAFNIRIDYDEYDPGDFARLWQTISGREEQFSHYVCGSAYERRPKALARLIGSDVGSHGYWHHTYRGLADNLRNLRSGIESLQRAGIEPCGFVAPHGRFNSTLLQSLITLGVSHSSEFSLSYDDLPFFPRGCDVLQVPVHPVSLGSFLEAAAAACSPTRRFAVQPASLRHASSGHAATRTNEVTTAAAVDLAAVYFQRVVTARYLAGEPVFLYGHPTRRLGRYPQVLGRVLETIDGFSAVWKTSLREFARWWRERRRIRLRVLEESQDRLAVIVDQGPRGYRMMGHYYQGEHLAPLALELGCVRFSPSELAFEQRRPMNTTSPVRVDRPQDIRSVLRRYLDFDRVTPLNEIDTSTWRGWMKRQIRQWRPETDEQPQRTNQGASARPAKVSPDASRT
jgi:hypothetical protein